jgi:DNA end-binding protein Ku
MPARSLWKGHIRLSLVSVPVRAYTASDSGGEVHLRQLHRECHSPINYRKVCPIHGELQASDIVSGYEHSKGQFVIIDPAEMEKLRGESEKSVSIEGFVPEDAIDPLLFTGKTYYLVPDGPAGVKPYALLHQGMIEEGRFAVAQVVLFGREHVAVVRPMGRLLGMTTLFYSGQVKEPAAFDEEIPRSEPSAEELKLARTLIQASVIDEFDIAAYKDNYATKLNELIQKKVQGQEIVAPPPAEQPKVINLMDALKESLAEARRKAPAAKGDAARKKMAPSARAPEAAARRKRKSS